MNYFPAMKAVLQFDEAIYPLIMESGKSVAYCMYNVLTMGLLYAFFVLFFSDLLITPEASAVQKLFFLVYGIGTAFLMHAGAALYLWVFTRGAGGRIEFLPVYFNLGVSVIGLWPLAAVLAAVQTGFGGLVWHFLLALTSVYGLAVIFFGAKSASQLSMARMAVAFSVGIVVIASLLYLWL